MSRTSMRDDLSALYSPQERRQVTPSRQRVVRGGAAREDQRQRPESRPSSDGHPPMATKAAPNAGASASPAADASAVRAAYDIAYRKRFGFVGGHDGPVAGSRKSDELGTAHAEIGAAAVDPENSESDGKMPEDAEREVGLEDDEDVDEDLDEQDVVGEDEREYDDEEPDKPQVAIPTLSRAVHCRYRCE